MRRILLAGVSALVLTACSAGVQRAYAYCPTPNPNLSAGVGGGFVDNCPLPAVALNNLAQATVVVNPPPYPADAVPAINAALTSNNVHVIIKPGSYSLCTRITTGFPYGNIAYPSILIEGRTNVTLDMRGATFQACTAITSGNTGQNDVMADRSTSITMLGGTFIGNMTGKIPGGDTVAEQFTNCIDCTTDGETLTGDWSSLAGVGVDGYWDINFTAKNAVLLNCSIGYDMGFLNGALFDNVIYQGAFGGVAGVDAIDIFHDPTSTTYNYTGVNFADSQYVTIRGFNASGANSGWAVLSGGPYVITHNHWQNNIGTPGSFEGWGGIIGYNSSGAQSSVGFPVHDVRVIGDVYTNNGNATSGGGGILIENGNLTGGDQIKDISIDATFSGNLTHAINPTATTGIVDLNLAGATCDGSAQTYCADPFAMPQANLCTTILDNNAVATTVTSAAAALSLPLPPGIWTLYGTQGVLPNSATTISINGYIDGIIGQPAHPGAPGNNYELISTTTEVLRAIGPIQVSIGGSGATYYLSSSVNFTGTSYGMFGSLCAKRG